MKTVDYPKQNTSRKDNGNFQLDKVEDTFSFWVNYYLNMAIYRVRSEEVSKKINLHLNRFKSFFEIAYGHGRLSACVKRDVLSWQNKLKITCSSYSK